MADLTVPNNTAGAVAAYLAGTAQNAQSNIGMSLGANPDLEAELSRIESMSVAIPSRRINVASGTTVYLVAQATFTASTETVTCVLQANRRR
ncbi:hypothetical protein [Paraburkholderia diazotrophica]|uniref:Uncharacterized protein n=1 Tax=Paraburkholderia diazotrophica TaxID=667676 RepID=A0A1H6UX97_9BURK|nr:hypothetical protein [Paraburkholderia diazotrophica]SEI96276.1 hypothetical protein SAMN05192539_1005211 [Paraburkholderia diazotrophica]